MFASVTVAGSIALLNVIDTVRPLTLVAVIVGEVVSASVNVIGPAGDQALAVFRLDRLAGRALDREGVGPVGRGRARRPGEAERELNDRWGRSGCPRRSACRE